MTDTESRRFVKSSRSAGNGGNCVEWAFTPAGVNVRDSKDRSGPELFFTFAEWEALTATVASGAAHESVSVAREGVRMTGSGGQLFFTPSEWDAFVTGARAGECRPSPGTPAAEPLLEHSR